MKFRDFFSIKHILFAVCLFALFIGIAVWESNTQVEVTFESTALSVYSDRYTMNIPYDQIASAELSEVAEPGEQVENGYDDKILRAGHWKNDAWGDYYACLDLDTSNCIVVRLEDGRIFVISQKDDKETASIYETLQTHLTEE